MEDNNIKTLNDNIVHLNRTIQLLLEQNALNNGGGGNFSVNALQSALLNPEIQALITKIVLHNQFHQAPLVMEGIEPIQETISSPPVPVQQPTVIVKKQEVQPEKVLQKVEEPQENGTILEMLYTIKSPKNGYFPKTQSFHESQKTQYCIEVLENGEGLFFIHKEIDYLRMAISSDKFLKPACDSDKFDFLADGTHTPKITTLKKGRVKKEGDSWKIIKKAIIKIDKEKINE